jgi:hypothetical protein
MRAALCATALLACVVEARGAETAKQIPDELRIKREAVYEFAEKPTLTRDGDDVTIRFAVRAPCTATIAVERQDGSIARHLASGALGPNAPEPFQKDSLGQTVVWDGKDDQGRYIDDLKSHRVRVSLGLRARFERTLFWSPKKRTRSIKYINGGQLVAAGPQGVYVYDSGNCEFIRLFDHDGRYVRTVYPPPRAKLGEIDGLKLHTFPQSGRRLPLKWTRDQNTFLTWTGLHKGARWPGGGSTSRFGEMAVRNGRIALVHNQINRLTTDGTTPPGLPLTFHCATGEEGKQSLLHLPVTVSGSRNNAGGTYRTPPSSIAISPDGRWLYLTGYYKAFGIFAQAAGTHAVMRMPYSAKTKADAPKLFAGTVDQAKPGSKPGEFNTPMGVAVDDAGRIYVADHKNNRVQILSDEGAFLKQIECPRAMDVAIHHETGEVYCFGWELNRASKGPPVCLRYSAFPELQKTGGWKLPCRATKGGARSGVRVALDSWVDPPRLWVAHEAHWRPKRLEDATVKIYTIDGRKLEFVRSFEEDAQKQVVFTRPVRHMKERLYFDSKHNRLYSGNLHQPCPFHCTSMVHVARIDPETNGTETVRLPFDAEDMAFDIEGRAYLRTADKVVRFDPTNWREVPFDYGMKFKVVNTLPLGSHGGRATSAIHFAGVLGIASGQMGGMGVSPKGHLVMSVCNPSKERLRTDVKDIHTSNSKVETYTPPTYPGRERPWEVHVWDEHGKLAYVDAVPGVPRMVGINMDRDDAIYVMVGYPGPLKGKWTPPTVQTFGPKRDSKPGYLQAKGEYFNPLTCTYVKLRPGTKFLSPRGVIPLPPGARPKRGYDLRGRWIEGPEWLRGGGGTDGKHMQCHCGSQSRPALDYYARSFLPEVDHYSVLVVDSNGNRMLRIGQYGNVDDGMPLVKNGGPPNPRKIGGDEVGIMHTQMLAVHTDRRLFIGDLGNARIAAVKLEYAVSDVLGFE